MEDFTIKVSYEPSDKQYMASINEGVYKGTVVVATTLLDCLSQLRVTIFIADDFRMDKEYSFRN